MVQCRYRAAPGSSTVRTLREPCSLSSATRNEPRSSMIAEPIPLKLNKQGVEWATGHGLLDPFDCREPGWCAVVAVESRMNPVRFDGSDIPSIVGVERRSQLFLTDGVRASIGTIVAEAQHIQSSIVLGHRR